MNAETRSRTHHRTSWHARRTTRWLGALAATLALAFVSRTAEAQFTTLHVFNGSPDGATPGGGLIRGADGNFYGSTQSGGTADLGTIYRITPAGVTTILHSFLGPEGADPFGELVRGTDGNFYGTTALGGSAQPFNGPGVIFRMTPAGAFTVLHIFDGVNGQRPTAGLVQGPDGNFYGVTPRSGATNNGVIFRITPGGVYTVLRSFTGADGSVPSGALIVGPGNNLFGVTAGGGTANGGTVYRITPAGVFTSLHSFTFAAGDGNNPLGALVVGADGNFYGTTEFGGTAGGGTTYRMTPAGVTTILHSFAGPEGLNPLTGLALASDGKFYGTTQVGGANNNGVVFSMTAAGAVVAVHSFVAPGQGSNPTTKVLQGADGALYGTTPSNGSGPNPRGTVYRLAIAAGPATTTTKVQVTPALHRGGRDPFDAGRHHGPDLDHHGADHAGVDVLGDVPEHLRSDHADPRDRPDDDHLHVRAAAGEHDPARHLDVRRADGDDRGRAQRARRHLHAELHVGRPELLAVRRVLTL